MWKTLLIGLLALALLACTPATAQAPLVSGSQVAGPLPW
jgi:hypothetical protein